MAHTMEMCTHKFHMYPGLTALAFEHPAWASGLALKISSTQGWKSIAWGMADWKPVHRSALRDTQFLTGMHI